MGTRTTVKREFKICSTLCGANVLVGSISFFSLQSIDVLVKPPESEVFLLGEAFNNEIDFLFLRWSVSARLGSDNLDDLLW